jgi:ubiquinone/menaquinone biosynthesis C-methylase UbiE
VLFRYLQVLQRVNKSSDSEVRERHNREFFDKWSKQYDHFRISPWFRYTQELAIKQLDLRTDGTLLDVGCGTGYATCYVAALLPDGKAFGIDISQDMVDKAVERTPSELGDRVEFRQAGAENIPYASDEFDYVLCTNSFHHYHQPTRALDEMRRVLKPGGSLVIFENAPDLSLYTWLWDRWLRLFEKGHVRYYPSSELGVMIKQAGYKDVELRVLRNEIFKYGKLFASIQIWAACKPEL